MNNVIEFKKDCIMKTMVHEITDISLTHDYKIMSDMIEGYFDVSGEYKATASSVSKEDFMYTIPFSIALSSMIDKSSINLTIKDFNYEVDKDVLHLKMALNMEYEEIKIEEATVQKDEINESIEEALEEPIHEVTEENELTDTNEYHNELMNDLTEEDNIDLEDKKEAQESMSNIISSMGDTNSFYKYKIYIMREEDTIESIAIKYNVTLDELREYNELENIHIGDKIVVPIINTKDEN